MPTLTFKAVEMKDAKVAHISLVDRAATRIPFKITKQEKPMNVLKHLDIASVFKGEAAKPAAPKIVGVITMKSDGFDSIKKKIGEAGFSVEKQEDQADGSVVFAQSEDMAGDHVLIRLSENAVMAVKSFSPYSMNMTMGDGTSFAEVCKAQGFYPGVGTMVDVLRSGVLQLAEKSDDPAAAATKVGKMFDEAKQYAMAMVGALPSVAFKLESIEPDAETDEEVKKRQSIAADAGNGGKSGSQTKQNEAGEGMPNQSGDGGNGGTNGSQTNQANAADSDSTPNPGGDTLDKTAVHGEGGHGQTPAKIVGQTKPKKAVKADGTPADDEEVEAVTLDQVTEMVNKSMQEFATKMESLLGGVTEAVKTVGTSVQALTTRVETAEGVAKAAQEAVSGTVVLGSDGGDPAAVAKGEQSHVGREIDTGFMPHRRNQAGRR